jgi:hypothetical protein
VVFRRALGDFASVAGKNVDWKDMTLAMLLLLAVTISGLLLAGLKHYEVLR